MRVFEIDFLSRNFLQFPHHRLDLSPSKDQYARWLIDGIGASAERHGISVQLCMAMPFDVLLAVHAPSVTQIRASQDYSSCIGWDIGISSLLLWPLGFSPSKDVFWTTAVEPGNPYATNPNTKVQIAKREWPATLSHAATVTHIRCSMRSSQPGRRCVVVRSPALLLAHPSYPHACTGSRWYW